MHGKRVAVVRSFSVRFMIKNGNLNINFIRLYSKLRTEEAEKLFKRSLH